MHEAFVRRIRQNSLVSSGTDPGKKLTVVCEIGRYRTASRASPVYYSNIIVVLCVQRQTTFQLAVNGRTFDRTPPCLRRILPLQGLLPKVAKRAWGLRR